MFPRHRIAGFIVVGVSLAVTLALLFYPPIVSGAATRRGRGTPPRLTVIDGSQVEAGFAPRPASPPPADSQLISATDSPAVLTDGWTMRDGDSRSRTFLDAECYNFVAPTTNTNRILFNSNFKIPRGGVPNEIWGDLIVFTGTPRIGSPTGGEDMPPVPPQAVVFDDIRFGNPGAASDPYQIVGFVSISAIESNIGRGNFDWMLVTDSAGLTASDDDQDGNPDVDIEVPGGQAVFKLRPSVDELGGGVIEAFAGNVRRINVFEPAGTYPPARAGYTGMQAGETGHTRPWCFHIQ